MKVVDTFGCPESEDGHSWYPFPETAKMDLDSLEFVMVDVECEFCGMVAKEKYERTIVFEKEE